jgi:hypothetical protein
MLCAQLRVRNGVCMWAISTGKSGLRIRGQRGHPLVRIALIRFAWYLRTRFEFPVRVPVYLSPHDTLTMMDGGQAVATFFAPWLPDVEPYIRLATGDFASLRKQRSCLDHTLSLYLQCLAHEVIHYKQWILTGEIHEVGVKGRASMIVRDYSMSVDRYL